MITVSVLGEWTKSLKSGLKHYCNTSQAEISMRLDHIHTYIIVHYNPSVRIIDLVSNTTYVVAGGCSLKSTPNDRFFEKLFMALLFTLIRNLLRGNRRINTFCILFVCLACDQNPVFTSNKPTHLLDHGDFFWITLSLKKHIQVRFDQVRGRVVVNSNKVPGG